jgi:hypothetical protein
MGDTKGGAFDIPAGVATAMLDLPNPDGRSNRDVVLPWANGLDITGRPRNMWIIDFGTSMPIEEAALYERPFEYVKEHVKPQRDESRSTIAEWWLHERRREEMREALSGLDRYIVTPCVAKHRLFVWLTAETLPDHALIAFARDDDYFFGVLHSSVHESWARGLGTQVREVESGFRYTPTTTFETFPFPQGPSAEALAEVEAAARSLSELREGWLNPPDAMTEQLCKRTLTKLYNQRPTWLEQAHERLDRAVYRAYGWSHPLAADEVLTRLLEMNLAESQKSRRIAAVPV